MCVCVWGESLWLHNSFSLLSVCRTDKSISNDKMRLTLNLGDDAMYPAGHPLSPCFLSSPPPLSSPPLCHGKEGWRGKNADKQKWLCSVSTWCDRRPMFVAIDGPRCHGKSIPLVSPQTIATAIARWEWVALEMNVWACVRLSVHTQANLSVVRWCIHLSAPNNPVWETNKTLERGSRPTQAPPTPQCWWRHAESDN